MKFTIHPARLAACGLAALAPTAGAQNPASTITTTGQELMVEIDCPAVSPEGPGQTLVTAKASLGPAQQSPVNVVLVLDLSTTMGAGGNDIVAPAGVGPEDDLNGDGAPGQVVDALIAGLLPFSESLGSSPNVDVAIVWFSDQSFVVDMGPGAGILEFISPPNRDDSGNGIPDIADVISSLDVTSVGAFTPQSSIFGTNYNAALTAMNALFAGQPAGETNVAFFMSDGKPNMGGPLVGPGTPLQAAIDAGTVINSFGFGVGAADLCDPGKPLDSLATGTGGSCTIVANPANLGTKLPAANSASLVRLELYVNQQLAGIVFGQDDDQLCLVDVDVTPFLQPGVNAVEACVLADDQTSVCALKDLQDTLCKLLVGMSPASLQLPDGDVLLLDHLWSVQDVTMSLVPTFAVPNDASLVGARLHFQVGMYNEVVFPNDPLQLSNGVELVVGSGWKKYGPTTTMDLWLDGNGHPGTSLTPRFSIANLP